MTRIFQLAALTAVLSILCISVAGPARATLVGDFVDLSIDFDDPQHTDRAVQQVEVVTVQPELRAGFTGPQFFVFGEVTANVEESSIILDLFAGTEGLEIELPFLPAFTFVADDLQWVGQPGFVLGDVIPDAGNSPGFSVSSFGNDVVTIAFAGVGPTMSQTLTARAVFELVHVAPEPGGLAGLFLAGVLAAVFRRG